MATLGIDFGSSYSTVSWINPKSGKPEAVKFYGDGSVKLPSAMLATEDGFMLGFQAASYLEEVYKLPFEQRMEMMANFIPSLKRALDPKMKESYFGKDYTHLDLLKVFYRNLIAKARDHCGKEYEIDHIVFSHPVDFAQTKVQMIKKAFEEIGYPNLSTLVEPVAAVKGFGIGKKINEEEGILVFDFGGGTIDVAFVKNLHGELKVVTQPKGNSKCGGLDIDYLLYEDLRKKIHEQYDFDISKNGIVIDHTILSCCRRLKEKFSGDNDAYDTVVMSHCDGELQTYKYRLSRDAFNSIISAKVYEAINIAKAVVEDVKNKQFHIDRVLLIGGSSELTLVKELLSEVVGNVPIEKFGEKDIAVALGCLSGFTQLHQDEILIENKENKEDEFVFNEENGKEEPIVVIHRELSAIQEKYKKSKQLKKQEL